MRAIVVAGLAQIQRTMAATGGDSRRAPRRGRVAVGPQKQAVNGVNMSETFDPPPPPAACLESSAPSVALLIQGRPRDLGGFSVRRVLPAAKRRLVGPFIFLDEMGPADILPGAGFDVRPHPHIALAT